MTSPLASLIASGTKLWLDSVDPDLVRTNRALGATGATSNPIIISDLIKTGRFDADLEELVKGQKLSEEDAAWQLTDEVVRAAQKVFFPVWEETKGNDGYVSFELDPLLEDPACKLSVEEKAARYIELGKKWSAGHRNRMIKVPATPGGLAALEELCAAGVTLNVTLIFSMRQYEAARDADLARCAEARVARALQERVQHLRLARRRVHGKVRAGACRRPRRGRSASWTRSGSGRRIRSSGPTRARRSSKK